MGKREPGRVTVAISFIDSPLGRLGLALAGEGVVRIALPPLRVSHLRAELTRRFPGAHIVETAHPLPAAQRQLGEYLEGRRKRFTLPFTLHGTPFQRRVLGEVARIPYGETRSYGEIARRIGKPGAARAIGAALNRNPLPLVIPCHRVVGADGSLVGFAGGIRLKQILLDIERGSPPVRRCTIPCSP